MTITEGPVTEGPFVAGGKPFAAPGLATVAGLVGEAQRAIGSDAYLSQATCIDWLLDCLNVAVRSTVRIVIGEELSAISHLSLVTAQTFSAALDQIHLALQVDAAFDHFELDPA